jgi:hypothetical protein
MISFDAMIAILLFKNESLLKSVLFLNLLL